MATIGAAKAKARFLSVIEEVAAKRQPMIVTKRGRAMVQIVPMPELPEDDPLAVYKFGGGSIIGDILSPANEPDDWEYD